MIIELKKQVNIHTIQEAKMMDFGMKSIGLYKKRTKIQQQN